MCEHAISAIRARDDAPHIDSFLDEARAHAHISLAVPLWPEFFIWEDLKFEVVRDAVFGSYGRLINRGKHATYDLGVTRLLRGESANDLSATMVRQFVDVYEVDRPTTMPGCMSGQHKMPYQARINKLVQNAAKTKDMTDLTPHLYGLLGRKICAYCWADMYGGPARRVSGNPEDAAAVADDFNDLLFEG
jgi:hypothetical protein